MKHFLTILFTFYCNDVFRRKYIVACLKSLNRGLKGRKHQKIKILAIDGSTREEAQKNKILFDNEVSNLIVEYVFDETLNPNQRINNNIDKIKSEYVLRLLEDCIFRCETFVNDITEDCKTLEFLPSNSIIIHPFIDTEDIVINGQTLNFPLPNINNKKTVKFINGRKVYDRREDRPHHNFITTGSVLYKYDFFAKHFHKFSQSGTDMYETDDNIFAFRFFPIFIQRMLHVLIRVQIIKFFLKEYAIQHAYVTESCLNFNVIHIGVETLSEESRFTTKSELRSNMHSLHQLSKLKNFDWGKGFKFRVVHRNN